MACKPCEERRKLLKNAIKSKVLKLKLFGRHEEGKKHDKRILSAGKTGSFYK